MNVKAQEPYVAECLGVMVPPSPYLNETRIARINAARYEGQEIAGALHVVRRDDRVLELGAGLGIVGAVIQKNAAPAAMTSFEANPNMIEHIEALYSLNRIKSKITLHNKVLISAPERPETIEFFLRNSFLGSSLTDNDRRETKAVAVPTAGYEELRAQFQPTVLVMDIEGGELELLRYANLDGLRAMVVEFHPEVYGVKGMRECKNILRDAGFQRVNEISTRTVWTVERPDRHQRPKSDNAPVLARPEPESGWSRSQQLVEGALVIPTLESGLVKPAGVLTSAGEYIPEGALWRRDRSISTKPQMPDQIDETLTGKWLWGGQLWKHFGHFLAESLGRLWPLETSSEGFDGILFTPKRPQNKTIITSWQKDIFSMLAPNLEVRIATAPTRVEQLVVPGQGFGLGPISAGTPEFRMLMQNRLGAKVEAKGSEKLYISRSRFGISKGALIGEEQLEALLAADGYEIFHPQAHSIEEQLARYKAAKKVIAAEGSAIHMLAMVAPRGQDVAIVLRRRSSATDYIENHLRSFADIEALSIDALIRNWMPNGQTRARLALAEIDFPRLQEALLMGGFISASSRSWGNLDESHVSALLGEAYHITQPRGR